MRYWTAQMQRAGAPAVRTRDLPDDGSAWRRRPQARGPTGWTVGVPFAETIDRARKYVVSSTLGAVDWNAELVLGDLEQVVRQLRRAGRGLVRGGVTLPRALADLGLIGKVRVPGAAGPRRARADPARWSARARAAQLVDRQEFRSGRSPCATGPRQQQSDSASGQAEVGGDLGSTTWAVDVVVEDAAVHVPEKLQRDVAEEWPR